MFWCITCDGYGCKGARVVVVGNTDATAAEALQLQRFTNQLTMLTDSQSCAISPTFRERLERASIALIRDKPDGLLLIGDASGYVNPLFGDGILRALVSAKHAAATLTMALRQGDCSRAGLVGYERRHLLRDRLDAILLKLLEGMSRRPALLLQLTSLDWLRHALFSALLRE